MTSPDSVPVPTPDTAAQRAEVARQVAEASATAYVDGITNGGVPASEIDPRQAFIDGFLTAIESLLTMGERHV